MNKELIVRVNSSDIDLALLYDGNLTELHKESRTESLVLGDILLAKVKKVVSGLSAAFVDVGGNVKEGFLHYNDLGSNIKECLKFTNEVCQDKIKDFSLKKSYNQPLIDKNGDISDVLKVNQTILVQVVKEPISTKGPRLSSEITLLGRYLILVPFSKKITVSKKIRNNKESKRLVNLIKSIRPKGFGVIIRTAAIEKKVVDLDSDLSNLYDRWLKMCAKLSKVSVPSVVMSETNKATVLLRDMFDEQFSGIYVDNMSVLRQIQDYINLINPEKVGIVKYYNSMTPIFEKYGIERQIKSSFGRTVMMKKGAYLVVEHTEALHVIDVNSGGQSNKSATQQDTALNVNLVAAEEITKQLRLRDMGGIIVIDFIDMKKGEDRKKLYDFFRKKMSDDRAKHTVLPPSKIGLIQMTRQRVRPEVNISTEEKNPSFGENDTIFPPILHIERISNTIEEIISKKLHKKGVYLNVHPFIAAYLTKGILSIRFNWYLKHKVWVKIIPRDAYSYLHYTFKNKLNSVIKI